MKQLFIIFFILMLVFTSELSASPSYGTYMFTSPGNDLNTSVNTISNLIEGWFASQGTLYELDLKFYSKAPVNTEELDLTYNDNYSGIWKSNRAIEFYSVKAGNQFAFYWMEIASLEGLWSTHDLLVGNNKIPKISHLSVWYNDNDAQQTPEPRTVVSVMLGLILLTRLLSSRKFK